MYISPPITVLAILAIAYTATVLLTPPPREIAHVTLVIPSTTYKKLVLWGQANTGTDGRPLTVVQVIEELAKK